MSQPLLSHPALIFESAQFRNGLKSFFRATFSEIIVFSYFTVLVNKFFKENLRAAF